MYIISVLFVGMVIGEPPLIVALKANEELVLTIVNTCASPVAGFPESVNETVYPVLFGV